MKRINPERLGTNLLSVSNDAVSAPTLAFQMELSTNDTLAYTTSPKVVANENGIFQYNALATGLYGWSPDLVYGGVASALASQPGSSWQNIKSATVGGNIYAAGQVNIPSSQYYGCFAKWTTDSDGVPTLANVGYVNYVDGAGNVAADIHSYDGTNVVVCGWQNQGIMPYNTYIGRLNTGLGGTVAKALSADTIGGWGQRIYEDSSGNIYWFLTTYPDYKLQFLKLTSALALDIGNRLTITGHFIKDVKFDGTYFYMLTDIGADNHLVKIDTSMEIVEQVKLTGLQFQALGIDEQGNCYLAKESGDATDIVMFDSSLNITAQRQFTVSGIGACGGIAGVGNNIYIGGASADYLIAAKCKVGLTGTTTNGLNGYTDWTIIDTYSTDVSALATETTTETIENFSKGMSSTTASGGAAMGRHQKDFTFMSEVPLEF